jgi:predicted dehydrogenase
VTRVAVIGAGWYAAQSHIPTLQRIEGVQLDGVCRLGAAELERVQRHFGFAFASEDYREVLARRPEAVIVASPHALHYEHVRAAIEAGAHVLCEKPMTLDPAQAWDLVARADAAGRHLLVANGYHYLAGMDGLRRMLAEGAVGRIEHASCCFVSATRAVFEGGTGLARWAETFFRPSRLTWQDPAGGGGFAWGQASHSVALLLWLTGLRPVRTAAVLTGAPVDLGHAATMVCEGGGVVALSGAAAMPERRAALLRLVISGDEGVLEIGVDTERAALYRHDRDDVDIPVAKGEWRYHCAGPVEALIAVARGGPAAEWVKSPGEIGAMTVQVLSQWRPTG